ncbi:MAG: hypothetical protein ACM34K_11640 [Bacillota bacterium]
MNLAEIVYSTLALLASLIFILLIVSYLVFKGKQKAGPAQHYSEISYPGFRADARLTRERE